MCIELTSVSGVEQGLGGDLWRWAALKGLWVLCVREAFLAFNFGWYSGLPCLVLGKAHLPADLLGPALLVLRSESVVVGVEVEMVSPG